MALIQQLEPLKERIKKLAPIVEQAGKLTREVKLPKELEAPAKVDGMEQHLAKMVHDQKRILTDLQTINDRLSAFRSHKADITQELEAIDNEVNDSFFD